MTNKQKKTRSVKIYEDTYQEVKRAAMKKKTLIIWMLEDFIRAALKSSLKK